MYIQNAKKPLKTLECVKLFIHSLAGSYHAFGNDGNHYDIAINDGENNYFQGDVARSDLLAEALHIASDHIPVIVDYDVVEADKASQESK